AFYAYAHEFAAVDERLQIVVGETFATAKVVGYPARLRDAERAHGTQDLRPPDLRRVQGFRHLHADAVQDALGQIVDALEILAAQDHQFAECEPCLEPALLVLPAPPPRLAFLLAFEVRRLHRPVVADVREQAVHFGA